ncbi:MAG: ABC transporter ATP-binding protein [Acholeplasmatales bacterium]|jgi:simple sugar transport system ATP-binding protein|nr:ABC transporter ATP-binding protein [Acholeplasmatales bacterium]
MQYAIEMLGITKRFGKLLANDNITLKIQKGEIHAILGENGAGKSTLLSILFGLIEPDSGEIIINGEKAHIKNPNDAVRYKIGMVHQHFKLVKVFSVLENIILGHEDTKLGFLVSKKSKLKVDSLIKEYGFNLDSQKLVGDLTVGGQQKVEILKMLYSNSDILIFDEPTAVLTPQEIESLFKFIKLFKQAGKTIIIITHKLTEIKELADRCTILRKGKMIKTLENKEVSIETLANLMVGRDVLLTVSKSVKIPSEALLKIQNLTYYSKELKKNILTNLSFDVKRGEILGIAGIEGNGQTQLIELIYGLLKNNHKQAKIIFKGQEIQTKSIKERQQLGISLIPEDRQKHGLIMSFPVASNYILNQLDDKRFFRRGFLRAHNVYQEATQIVNKYDVRMSGDVLQEAANLSGGNQQKLILGRELSKSHDCLICVQPTRGLDVGAIEQIYHYLLEERQKDKAILLVSYELDELLDIADRLIIIHQGQIVGSFFTKDIDASLIGLYMLGIKKDSL